MGVLPPIFRFSDQNRGVDVLCRFKRPRKDWHLNLRLRCTVSGSYRRRRLARLLHCLLNHRNLVVMHRGYVFHADVLVILAVGHDAVVECNIRFAVVKLTNFKSRCPHVCDVQAFTFSFGREKNVIVERSVDGLAESGIEMDRGLPCGETARPEILKPVLGRLHGVNGNDAIVRKQVAAANRAGAKKVAIVVDFAVRAFRGATRDKRLTGYCRVYK